MKASTPQDDGYTSQKKLIRRYPGPRSFNDTGVDEHLFFGRDAEIAALTSRILARRTLVLFGRSGLGKTSLIQAGLNPTLRKLGYLPISIRLNDPEIDLLQTVRHALEQAAARDQVDIDSRESPSLWHLFKQTDCWQSDQLLTPLLVFDQFEEVFTLQDTAFRNRLAKALQELAGDAIPVSVRQAKSRGETLGFSLQPPELRLLFSLREEYVGSLESFITEIPTLLEHRYQLNPLSEEQASLAITQPAAYQDPISADLFATGPFAYDPAALQLIMQQLTNRRGEIEPFQLQLVCQYAENRVIEHRSALNQPITVDTGLLGGNKALVKVRNNFYHQALHGVKGLIQKHRARKLCEGLLNAEERRISIDEYTVTHKLHVQPPTLESLEESRLLRKDSRPGLDGFYYELSHDSVAEAVSKSRRKDRIIRRAIIAVGLITFGGYTYLETKMFGKEVATQSQKAENRLIDYAEVVKQLYRESGAVLPEMARIEPGCFMMGSKKDSKGEAPVREVCIEKAFYLGRYAVTFEEYDRFAVATGNSLSEDRGWGRGRRPVIYVNMQNTSDFTDWLSMKTETQCRLPTEAEWEYAARAGTITEFALPAPNGSDDIVNKGLANCDGCGSEWDKKHPAPVGSFEPNAWGLHDMHGNVWEWTTDCWHENHDKAPKNRTSWLKEDGSNCRRRVLRGGSWYRGPDSARSASRGWGNPSGGDDSVGFRVLCSGPFKKN